MDYRYYKGEPLIRLPQWMQRFVPWMQFIGISFCVLSLVIPMLIIVHVIESTLFLNCLTLVLNFYGVVLWIYGHSLRKVKKEKDEELSATILEYYNKKRNNN
jgi:hypothetical protein